MLKERLQFLGLHAPWRETVTPTGGADHDGSSKASPPSTPPVDKRFLDHPNNPYFQQSRQQPTHSVKDPLRRYPTVHEVFPDDSISMYKPRGHSHQPPAEYGRTPTAAVGRRGGTDVDPGEGAQAYLPEGYDQQPMTPYSADGLTAATPRSMAYLEPTMGPGSTYTRGTQ